MRGMVVACLTLWALAGLLRADVIRLKDGGRVEGEIVKEEAGQVQVRTALRTVTLARKDIEAIERRAFTAPHATGSSHATGARGRLPDGAAIRQVLRQSGWAKGAKQVAAAVVADGDFRNVPYVSYRAVEDYEINVYGAPAAPLGVEVGLHNMPAKSQEARRTCLGFICGLLTDPEDGRIADKLDLTGDHRVREGLTFEVAPASAEGSRGVWWVRVYDDRTMDIERAGKEELERVTRATWIGRAGYRPMPRDLRPGSAGGQRPGGEEWSDEEMVYARREHKGVNGTLRVYVREFCRKDNAYAPAHEAPK